MRPTRDFMGSSAIPTLFSGTHLHHFLACLGMMSCVFEITRSAQCPQIWNIMFHVTHSSYWTIEALYSAAQDILISSHGSSVTFWRSSGKLQGYENAKAYIFVWWALFVCHKTCIIWVCHCTSCWGPEQLNHLRKWALRGRDLHARHCSSATSIWTSFSISFRASLWFQSPIEAISYNLGFVRHTPRT